jgi:hypothetical protein
MSEEDANPSTDQMQRREQHIKAECEYYGGHYQLENKRARQRDALLLSARQLRW